MNMKKTLLSAIAAFAILPEANAAGVHVDPELKAYMSRPEARRQITVIATFEDTLPTPEFRPSALTYRAARKHLERNAMESQAPAIRALRERRGQEFAAIQNVKPLWIANAMIIRMNSGGLNHLLQLPRLKALHADREAKLIQPVSRMPVDPRTLASKYTYGLEKLNIPAVREEFPQVTGEGVTIGVLDTGIDADHPDLRGRMKAFRDFVGKKQQPYDDHGHGTHVSGTIAGGSASRTEIGVAPKAMILSGKIFTAKGTSTTATILQGMQWMADPDENLSTKDHPVAISNSWGGGAPSPTDDPKDDVFCKAVDGWVKLGILPIFANGNSGPQAGTVSTPAGCPGALAVGATDSKDGVAGFSSRGPAKWKTGEIIKPDVSAPGVAVTSSVPGGKYATWSGTSMATPHTAGLAALLFQAKPNLVVNDVAALLMKSTTDLGAKGHDNDFGMGRIDALRALKPAMRR